MSARNKKDGVAQATQVAQDNSQPAQGVKPQQKVVQQVVERALRAAISSITQTINRSVREQFKQAEACQVRRLTQLETMVQKKRPPTVSTNPAATRTAQSGGDSSTVTLQANPAIRTLALPTASTHTFPSSNSAVTSGSSLAQLPLIPANSTPVISNSTMSSSLSVASSLLTSCAVTSSTMPLLPSIPLSSLSLRFRAAVLSKRQ